MPVIIRLQNLPKTANSGDIRKFFGRLHIPEGGVHILGGELGDAFIVFLSDIDARIAVKYNGKKIHGASVRLRISSYHEMKYEIESVTHCEFVELLTPKSSASKRNSSPEEYKYSSRKDVLRQDEKLQNSSRCRLSSPVQELDYYLEKTRRRQSVSPEVQRTKYFKSHSFHEKAHSSHRKSSTPDSRSRSPRRSPSFHKKSQSSSSRSRSPWRHERHKTRYPSSRSRSPRSRSRSPHSRYHSHHSRYHSHHSRSQSSRSRSHSFRSRSCSHHERSCSRSRQRRETYYSRRESVSSCSKSPSPHRRSESPYLRHHNSHKKHSSSCRDQESLEDKYYSSSHKKKKNFHSAYSKEIADLLEANASYDDVHFSFTPDATKQSSVSDSFSHASDLHFQDDFQKKYTGLISEKLFSGNSSDPRILSAESANLDMGLDPQALLEKRIRDALNNGYDTRLKAEFNALHFGDQLTSGQNHVLCTEAPLNNLYPKNSSILPSNFHEINSPGLADVSHESSYFEAHSAPLPPMIQSFPNNMYMNQNAEFNDVQNETQFPTPNFQSKHLLDYRHQTHSSDHKFVLLSGLSPTCTLKDIHAMFKKIHVPPHNIRWILDNKGIKTGIVILKLKKRDFYKVLTKRKVIYKDMSVRIKFCPPAVYQAHFVGELSIPEPIFHEDLCYMLKGLPFTVTQEDIYHFFDGIQIEDIYIVYNNKGRATGTGFITFPDVANFMAAGERNGRLIGRRYIETIPSTVLEMVEAKRKNGDLELDMKSIPSKRSLCAVLTGLPTNITTSKVSVFFSKFGLRPDCIHITLNDKHQPNGRAFVEFSNISDFDAALKCHGNLLDNNLICVKQILYDEMMKILDKQKAKHGFGEPQRKESDNLPEKVPYLWDPTDDVVDEMTVLPESEKVYSAILPENQKACDAISFINTTAQDKVQNVRGRKSIQNHSNLIKCKITEHIEPFNEDSKVIPPKEVSPNTSKKLSSPSTKKTDDKIVKDVDSKKTTMTPTKERTAEMKTEIPGLTLVTESTYDEKDEDVIIIEDDDVIYDSTPMSVSEKNDVSLVNKDLSGSPFRLKSILKSNSTKKSMHIPETVDAVKSSSSTVAKNNDSTPSTNSKKKFNQTRYFLSQQSELHRNAVSENTQECSLQLSNVPTFIDTDALVNFFYGFSILKEECSRRFTESGEPTGDVRVTFSSLHEAERALSTLNGRFLRGQPVKMFLLK